MNIKEVLGELVSSVYDDVESGRATASEESKNALFKILSHVRKLEEQKQKAIEHATRSNDYAGELEEQNTRYREGLKEIREKFKTPNKYVPIKVIEEIIDKTLSKEDGES